MVIRKHDRTCEMCLLCVAYGLLSTVNYDTEKPEPSRRDSRSVSSPQDLTNSYVFMSLRCSASRIKLLVARNE